MTDTYNGWWQDKDFGKLGETHWDANWAFQALIQEALLRGGTVYDNSISGAIKGTWEEVQEGLIALGGRRVHHSPLWRGDTAEHTYFVWKDSLVGAWFNEGDLEIRSVSSDKEHHDRVKVLAEKHVGPKVSAGRVYVLVSTDKGPKLQSIGVAASAMERGNYNPEVVEAFDHIAEDLATNSPCGRLVIFDGPPGTGKTYLIRALLKSVPDALFVIVPAHLIPQLSNPGMINALVDARRNKGDLPTVFIVEDADDCLTPRAADNVNAVSALLNLGDGILGAMMDIRLICTTNAKSEDLDSAVTRPGRLCRMVHVEALRKPVAEDVYERLTGKRVNLARNLTLAEVYRLARDEGWKPEAKKSRVMGFGAPAEDRLVTAIDSGSRSIADRILEDMDDGDFEYDDE